MRKITEITQGLKTISQYLEKLSFDEKSFPVDMVLEMERMSWETYRIALDLEQINETFGGI